MTVNVDIRRNSAVDRGSKVCIASIEVDIDNKRTNGMRLEYELEENKRNPSVASIKVRWDQIEAYLKISIRSVRTTESNDSSSSRQIASRGAVSVKMRQSVTDSTKQSAECYTDL